MKYKFLQITILAFIFALSGATAHAQNYEGSKEEIEKILSNIKNFSEFYMNLDYEGIANSYTLDGMILPPDADIIQGKEAIKKRWTLPEGVSIPHHKITPVEIIIKNDLAYDVGYYEGRTKRRDGSEVSWRGKYVIIWKKIENDWKMYIDIWNRIED